VAHIEAARTKSSPPAWAHAAHDHRH
jgi:hypothetical protein